MNEEEMIRNIMDSVNAFAEPIDFKQLTDDGILLRMSRVIAFNPMRQ
ncbi:MAG: hypothetical protein Q7L07_16560 [Pseudohongiella sp.]|nr:hypothetical protein [Pseudohongiella sp.]